MIQDDWTIEVSSFGDLQVEMIFVRCYLEEFIIMFADLLQETPVNIFILYPF